MEEQPFTEEMQQLTLGVVRKELALGTKFYIDDVRLGKQLFTAEAVLECLLADHEVERVLSENREILLSISTFEQN